MTLLERSLRLLRFKTCRRGQAVVVRRDSVFGCGGHSTNRRICFVFDWRVGAGHSPCRHDKIVLIFLLLFAFPRQNRWDVFQAAPTTLSSLFDFLFFSWREAARLQGIGNDGNVVEGNNIALFGRLPSQQSLAWRSLEGCRCIALVVALHGRKSTTRQRFASPFSPDNLLWW